MNFYIVFITVIDVASIAIVLLPALIALDFLYPGDRSTADRVLYVLFSLYIAAVFSITGLPAIDSVTIDASLNFIPFLGLIDKTDSYIQNMVLNIFLFIPAGVLAPLIWNTFKSLSDTILLSLLLSLGIETLQLFAFRLTDIDDVIANTLGGIAGFCIYRLIFRLTGRAAPQPDLSHGRGYKNDISELSVLLALIFIIHFMLSPFISRFFWSFIS